MVPPQAPQSPEKEPGEPISAFAGMLSSDTPYSARMCVKSILQWHNVNLVWQGNKIMTIAFTVQMDQSE